MTASGRLPWKQIVRAAAVGTLAMVALVLVDIGRRGGNPLNIIQPGDRGPSIEVIREDFPDVQPLHGLGLDGQQYYAVARAPMHLEEVATQLDRPRYRLQRPLLSWLAWAVHPTGGGLGLVRAFLLVGIVGLFLGAVATGALSASLGGPAWLGFVFALSPGAYWSLRVTTADALALALALAAIACFVRGRVPLAIAAGCLAVLAKEPIVLVLVGWALYRRDRKAAALALVPMAVAGAWALWLRATLPAGGESVTEVTAPLTGLWGAITDRWIRGDELVGMASSVAAIALGVLALWFRGLSHPLGWIVALHLAFITFMNADVIGNNFGGTRSNMTLLVVSIVTLMTPHAQRVLNSTPPEHALAGAAGPGDESGGLSNR